MAVNRFNSSESLKIVPLGGVGEVTKNMFVYQFGKKCIIVDCGFGFPSSEMLGVDFVIPDISYLLENNLEILGIVATHGHEDHIGAIPYIAPQLGAPIFGSKVTIELIKEKLTDFPNLPDLVLNRVNLDDSIQLGPFKIDFVKVAHSVPESLNLLITSPVGRVYHGSDFKFDLTSASDQRADIARIAKFGSSNILLLLSDCLRAEKIGFTQSEGVIKENFRRIVSTTAGKVIITTTSSNLFRIKQAIEIAALFGRKVCLVGKSIIKASEVAKRLGYFDVQGVNFVEVEQLSRLNDNQLLLIVAGSQAQSSSALSQIANNQHPFVKIKSGDSVVFSSDPIPGNIDSVYTLIDNLAKLGAEVVYSDILDDLHVSGHGAADELMLLVSLLKPKFVMPISGGYRQMTAYRRLVKKLGYQDNQIILGESGRIVEISDNQVKLTEKIRLRKIMVDGLGVGDVGSVVLRDRQQIAADGFVIVIVPVDSDSGDIVGEPDIVSRGFVYMNRSKKLISNAKKVVSASLPKRNGQIIDWFFVRRQIEDNLERFLYNETRRRPMILPVVIEV